MYTKFYFFTKHVEFRDKIKFCILDASCWLFIRRLSTSVRRGSQYFYLLVITAFFLHVLVSFQILYLVLM
jgi:hypothetical protein